jgi:hypothetical protein
LTHLAAAAKPAAAVGSSASKKDAHSQAKVLRSHDFELRMLGDAYRSFQIYTSSASAVPPATVSHATHKKDSGSSHTALATGAMLHAGCMQSCGDFQAGRADAPNNLLSIDNGLIRLDCSILHPAATVGQRTYSWRQHRANQVGARHSEV